MDGVGRGRDTREVVGILGAVLLQRYELRGLVGIRTLGPDATGLEVVVEGGQTVSGVFDGIRTKGEAAHDVVVRMSTDTPPADARLCIDVEGDKPVAVSMLGFSEDQAGILAESLAQLWLGVAQAPETAVRDFLLQDPASSPAYARPAALPIGGPPVPPVRRLQEHARAHPDRVAVSDGERRLTYGGLTAEATRLSARLRALGVGRGTLVGLTGAPSVDLVVAIMAIHQIAAAYVPLDQANPECRLQGIVEDCGLRIVLDCGGGWSPADETLRVVHLRRSDEGPQANWGAPLAVHHDDGQGDPLPESGPTPDDLAYVLYTSGSTGAPKGVLVSQGNMARLFTETASLLNFGPDDTWTLFHSYAFDFSVWEIWGALMYGGRLVVVPCEVGRSPSRMLDLLAAERVTVLSQTPSAFAALAAAELTEDDGAPLHLRLVVLGGESVDYEVLARWVERHPLGQPRLVNMYGPTETTVSVTVHEVRPQDLRAGTRTIGRPIPDLRVHLLDASGSPVPDGAVGEIWIEGPGVAQGYLGRPELTRERFREVAAAPTVRRYRSGDLGRLDAEGLLEYCGRADDQVKVRGYRIELGEVEAAIRAHPDVANVCVAAEPGPLGRTRLVAYVVTGAEPGPAPRELIAFARDRLPMYMVPQAWHAVPALPLTVSGKLDRAALARGGAETRPTAGGAPTRKSPGTAPTQGRPV
ncbi:amino acid adenylation domain-containing protein [Streptomyces beigongshangae]|uniref:amino acid adenylation domain-containing protein n=1 Tax=Streptomyces beigongshangae TaxID=2841597 RepID=UPI001C85C232|nr:amino acid adenylation domain-containing protein [Streptomyces sp. REN17]